MKRIPEQITRQEFLGLDLRLGERAIDEDKLNPLGDGPLVVTMVDMIDFETADEDFEYLLGGTAKTVRDGILLFGYCCRRDTQNVLHQLTKHYHKPREEDPELVVPIVVGMETGAEVPLATLPPVYVIAIASSRKELREEREFRRKRYLQLLEFIRSTEEGAQ